MRFLKESLQFLIGTTGHAVISTRRFGWDIWQDISTLMGPVKTPIIFDVGAHTGQTLTAVKTHFPASYLYCFEPDPDSFRALSEMAKKWTNVNLYECAMGDVAGSAEFFRNAESMTNSLLPTAPEAMTSEVASLMTTVQKATVKVRTLDTFCQEQRIKRIDLLKVDCQGFDLHVLKGAERMLSEKNIGLIQCEAIFDPQYIEQAWFYDILDYLTGHGYALSVLHPPARNVHYEMTFADALFKPRFGHR